MAGKKGCVDPVRDSDQDVDPSDDVDWRELKDSNFEIVGCLGRGMQQTTTITFLIHHRSISNKTKLIKVTSKVNYENLKTPSLQL